jgi:hypothetical protein
MSMYEGYLPDRRLARRAGALQEALRTAQGVSVAALARTRAEQIGYYRLLDNGRVREPDLIEALTEQGVEGVHRLPPRQTPCHVLAPQDTSQMNLQAYAGRRKAKSGLGVIGDDRTPGFFVHPTLLIDATEGHALGFGDVVLWSRDPERPTKHERAYTQLPLETKESVRWVESLQRTRQRLDVSLAQESGPGPSQPQEQTPVMVTGIADSEGDLYPLFARRPDAWTHLLVRACRDRRIEESPRGLYAHLAEQPVLGCEEVEIRGDVRKPRTARRARLEYRITPVHLRRPRNWPEESEAVGTLWAIEVREVPETVPEGEEPILWRLLTTHRVESFAQARQVVAWYRQRWYIEQLFRLLKLEGLDLESSQLESGYALRRLCILALGAALDVLRLLLAERGQSAQPLGQVFTEPERACLQAVAAQVEGRTAKQQNPHPPQTLGWAAWIIARLGGWKGYRSQRPAGPITYRRGLKHFATLCQGYHLHSENVYTP